MAVIPVVNMHAGINFKDSAIAVAEGGVTESIGFDLTKEGSLVTEPVFSAHNLGSKIPVGDILWVEYISANGQNYVIVAADDGIYVDGTRVSTLIRGQFAATAVMNQIYIVSSSASLRYDLSDSTAYQLGIDAPTSAPTFTAAANVYQAIDTFEGSLADWITNGSGCTCAAETTIKKVGSKCLKFTVAANTTGYSYDDLAVDCAALSDGSESTEDDLVHFYIRADNVKYLKELFIQFDLVGTAFDSDYYSYTFNLPEEATASAPITPAKTTAKVVEDDASGELVITGYETVLVQTGETSYDYKQIPIYGVAPPQAEVTNRSITELFGTGTTDVISQTNYYTWRRNEFVNLESNSWCLVEIPKNYFLRYGDDTTKDWSDVQAVRFKISTAEGGAVNVYVDDLKIVGGGRLKGDYWFMYAWGRQDENDALVNWSSAARSSRQVLISGPVSFNRQQLTYAARPLSSDDQVNCGVVYILGGQLTDWRVAAIIEDNTTVTDTLDIAEEECLRLGVSFRNEPAPTGKDILYKYGRLWICGMSDYPAGVACSEITADGDVLLEAWSPVNVWLAEGERQLVSLSDFGSQNPMIVRGQSGEYQLSMADPADITTVQPLNKISKFGCLTRTSKVPFDDGELFPSINTFVLGNVANSKAVLPEFSSVISENNMQDAVGITVGWVSYFSFVDANDTARLVKIDRFRESLRAGTLSNKKCDCLFFDPAQKTPFAVYDGAVYRLGYAYDGSDYDLNIVSKGFMAEGSASAAWQFIEFTHNTGNQWLRCHVLIDGVQIGYLPFRSSRKKTTAYRFGPIEGNYLQFSFKGQYRAPIEIQLPIRIYYG